MSGIPEPEWYCVETVDRPRIARVDPRLLWVLKNTDRVRSVEPAFQVGDVYVLDAPGYLRWFVVSPGRIVALFPGAADHTPETILHTYGDLLRLERRATVYARAQVDSSRVDAVGGSMAAMATPPRETITTNCVVESVRQEDMGAVAELVAHPQGVGVGIGGIDIVVTRMRVQVKSRADFIVPGANVEVSFSPLPSDSDAPSS